MRKLILAVCCCLLPLSGYANYCRECNEITKDPNRYLENGRQGQAKDGELDTFDIVEASMNESCFNWRVAGGCVWLKVTVFPPSVQIRPSVKVAHYIPDLVISAYAEKGKNPWELMSWTDDLSDSLASSLFGVDFQGGHQQTQDGHTDSPSNIKFKFATAIGNPLASVYGQAYADYFMCKSGATSFMPYFNSITDNWLWRTPGAEIVTEALNIFTPGKSVVGERSSGEEYLFSNRWWGLYPRTGFVVQTDDYKAAAVVASRVASIATASDSLHVSKTANGDKKQGYWPPEEVFEWKPKTGQYQMLYPQIDSQCHLFGHIASKSGNGIDDGYADRRDPAGNYVWNLWREYLCCRKEGQKLIAHFGD